MVTPTVETGSADTRSAAFAPVFSAFYSSGLVSFGGTRMKTLETLSANGLWAVYIEVVSAITGDQLGRFSVFS